MASFSTVATASFSSVVDTNTVDPDVHQHVVAAAAEDGVSVSAWMTAAAQRALMVRDGLVAVGEWEHEHGALTPAELDAARRRVAAELAAGLSSRPA